MNTAPCQNNIHLPRRSLLRGTGVAGVSWLTSLADLLAVEAENAPKGSPARSVILLWLGGAASQLDTFDPHPATKIGGGVKTIATAVKGVEFAAGLEQTASVMQDVSLIRSMVSKGVITSAPFTTSRPATGPTPRSSIRASAPSSATSCRRRGSTSPRTSPSCRTSGPRAAVSSARSLTRSRCLIRSSPCLM